MTTPTPLLPPPPPIVIVSPLPLPFVPPPPPPRVAVSAIECDIIAELIVDMDISVAEVGLQLEDDSCEWRCGVVGTVAGPLSGSISIPWSAVAIVALVATGASFSCASIFCGSS